MPSQSDHADLNVLADHLQVQLEWAAMHRLPPGSNSEVGPLNAVAFWLMQSGEAGIRFYDSLDELDTDREAVLQSGDAAIMTTSGKRMISSVTEASWLSVGFSLRFFGHDYTKLLLPPWFRWQPSISASAELVSLMGAVARLSSPVARTEAPGLFPLAKPFEPANRWAATGITRALILFIWQEYRSRTIDLAESGGTPPDSPIDDSPDRHPHWLLSVLLHVSRQPESATVESMAMAAGLSQSQFNRSFRKHLGLTPLQQLTQTRLDTAAGLLLTTDDTVESIARAVGFESLSHFTRLFAGHFTHPPARYRQNRRSLRI